MWTYHRGGHNLVMSLPREELVEQAVRDLKQLRQGQALGNPSAVLGLSPVVRAKLAEHASVGGVQGGGVVRLMDTIHGALRKLTPDLREVVEAELNLSTAHSHPNLGERQQLLADTRKCSVKTIRRHGNQALEAFALYLVTGYEPPTVRDVVSPAPTAEQDTPVAGGDWRDELRRFWQVSQQTRVELVCSEIPPEERPPFASPRDRNYLRYAKFADLDSLIFAKTRLAQLCPARLIRDFSPSEHYDTQAERLIVIGGPPWNAKYRQFLPQLPFRFQPNPLGEDDPLVVPCLDDLTIGPRWSDDSALLEDVAVFARLTLGQGTVVFLLAGCLTLGVVGATKCFLDDARGARNARYITDLVDERDFVAVQEVRRVGDVADMTELPVSEPLLVLCRGDDGGFSVTLDNSSRYARP